MNRREAQNHLDDLQSDLLEATTANSQAEQKYHNAQATVKQLTNSRSHYQGFLETAQNEINRLEHDNDILTREKRSLERRIEEANSQLKTEKESVVILESLKEKAEVGKAFAITESGKIRKSLLFAEESLAKLSSEHNSLQQSLTEMQKEASNLKGQVTSYKTANSKMEKQIQDKEMESSELKDKLIVITKLHVEEQQRNEGLHAVLNAAEEEKSRLKLSFGRLQQTFTTQNQEMSSTIASLNKSQQEMKNQKTKLVSDITKQEVQLETEAKNLEKLGKEFDTLKHEKTATELELEKATELYRNSCMAYNQLAAVLTECFNDEFEPAMPEQGQKMAVFNTSFKSGVASQHVKPSPLGMKLKFLDNSKIVRTIRNLQSTTFEQQKLNAKLDEEIALLEEEIKTWKSSQKQLEYQNIELKNELLSVRSQYQGIESVKQEMDQAVASNNNKIRALESEMELLLKESGRMKEDLEISKLNAQADEVRMSACAQGLLEKQAKLNSENAILKEQMMVSEKNLAKKTEKMEQRLKSEKMKQSFGAELLKGVQKENEKLQRSLRDAREKIIQMEEEIKAALKHEQLARDMYAKQSQQSLQFELLTQRNVELVSGIRELEQKSFEQQKAHKQE